MLDDLFVQDGFTLHRTIEAVPGLHGKITVVYRPALNLARRAHQRAAVTGPEEYARADIDLIVKHVQTINGENVAAIKDKLPKLKPAVLGQLIDLVLGYSPADEENDVGN